MKLYNLSGEDIIFKDFYSQMKDCLDFDDTFSIYDFFNLFKEYLNDEFEFIIYHNDQLLYVSFCEYQSSHDSIGTLFDKELFIQKFDISDTLIEGFKMKHFSVFDFGYLDDDGYLKNLEDIDIDSLSIYDEKVLESKKYNDLIYNKIFMIAILNISPDMYKFFPLIIRSDEDIVNILFDIILKNEFNEQYYYRRFIDYLPEEIKLNKKLMKKIEHILN